MARVNLNEIDNKYYDVLREIGNIGAGNATTALAQLLNMKLDMRVPKVALLDFNKLAETIHIAVFHAAQRRMMLECPDLVDEAVRLGFAFFTEGKAAKKGETK